LLPKRAKATRWISKSAVAGELFELTQSAQARGWSAEELLRGETSKREKALRRAERKANVAHPSLLGRAKIAKEAKKQKATTPLLPPSPPQISRNILVRPNHEPRH
jgi:hypothetical protein